MWFWIASSSGLASALDKVINRISLKDQGRGNVVAFSFIYLLFISLFALYPSRPFNITVSANLVVLLIASISFWSLGSLLSFSSQSKLDVSLSTIISRARMLWLIPLGFVFLGENVSFQAISGMLIIFLGLSSLFYKAHIHKIKGVQSMFAASIAIAFGTIVNSILVNNYLEPAQLTFINMFGQAIVFMVILLWKKKFVEKTVSILKSANYLILLSAAIETYALIGLNWALDNGPASTSTAIYLAMSVFSVWAGVVFMNEKDHVLKKIIGSVLVTIGIIIVKVSS